MSISKHEIYVRALLEGYENLYESRHTGLWHLSDEMLDLETAIKAADLTEKQHQAISLVFFEHLEHKEASDMLGVERSVVSRHIRNAIKKIANIYEMWEALDNVS